MNLYQANEVRALDQYAIQSGISGLQLMKRAASASLDYLLEYFPSPEHITVVAGTGNNGGDGFLLAAQAAAKAIPVTVFIAGDRNKIKNDALEALQYLSERDVVITEQWQRPERGIIVDGLLGTGIKGTLSDSYQAIINDINHSELPVLALDIPSGLCSDTGVEQGEAIKADVTITFIGMKRGLVTGMGRTCAGVVTLAELDIEAAIFEQVPCSVSQLDLHDCLEWLPTRLPHQHKGCFGYAMLVGGDYGFGGACIMAAEMALRSGVGLAGAATRPEHVAALLSRSPEVMAIGVTSGQELEVHLDTPDAIGVGTGLGKSSWGEQLLQKVVATDKPLVLDADALNILSEGRVVNPINRGNWVLTPHPGEAARLLGITVNEVEADRFAAVSALQKRYGGVVILKGSGSLITDGEQIAVCPYGNVGMSSGGMGDILTGLITGLLAQGLSLYQAGCLALCLHSMAADNVAELEGATGMLATDLIDPVRELLNGYTNHECTDHECSDHDAH